MLLAGAGSAAILAGALGFQHIGEVTPCPLCVYQRWPHVAALVLALLGVTLLWRHARPLAILGAAAMLIGTGLGIYHTGIEQQWWQGPDSCTAGAITGLSAEQLTEQIMQAPLIRCDEILWEFHGLTLASLNAVISLGLAALWLSVAIRATRP